MSRAGPDFRAAWGGADGFGAPGFGRETDLDYRGGVGVAEVEPELKGAGSE